jgi:hypothetical protein
VVYNRPLSLNQLQYSTSFSPPYSHILNIIVELRQKTLREWGKKRMIDIEPSRFQPSSVTYWPMEKLSTKEALIQEWQRLKKESVMAGLIREWAIYARMIPFEELPEDFSTSFFRGLNLHFYDKERNIFWIQNSGIFAPCLGVIDPAQIPTYIIQDATEQSRLDSKILHGAQWVESTLVKPLHHLFMVAHLQQQLRPVRCVVEEDPKVPEMPQADRSVATEFDTSTETAEERAVAAFLAKKNNSYAELQSIIDRTLEPYEAAVREMKAVVAAQQHTRFNPIRQILRTFVQKVRAALDFLDLEWVSRVVADAYIIKNMRATLKSVEEAFEPLPIVAEDTGFFFWKAHRYKVVMNWSKKVRDILVEGKETKAFVIKRDERVVNDLLAMCDNATSHQREQSVAEISFWRQKLSICLTDLRDFLANHVQLSNEGLVASARIANWIGMNEFETCLGFNDLHHRLQNAVVGGLHELPSFRRYCFPVCEGPISFVVSRPTEHLDVTGTLPRHPDLLNLIVLNQFILFINNTHPPTLFPEDADVDIKLPPAPSPCLPLPLPPPSDDADIKIEDPPLLLPSFPVLLNDEPSARKVKKTKSQKKTTVAAADTGVRKKGS